MNRPPRTYSRVLSKLIDPSGASLRSLPGKERDLAIAADGQHVLAFDNLSSIQPRIADALCRLATGSGFATRALYTNREEEVFESARPIILNGIPDLAVRPDLAQRALMVELPRIEESARLTEAAFWADFDKMHGGIFGALLDVLVGALALEPHVDVHALPRMADFALLGVAVERALGWREGTFLRDYAANRQEVMETALGADPLATAVQALVDQHARWIGTATELQTALEAIARKHPALMKALPRSPSALSGHLSRLAPALDACGIQVRKPQRTADRRLIELEKPPQNAVTPVTRDTPLALTDLGVTAGAADDAEPSLESQPTAPQVSDAPQHDSDDGRDGRSGPPSTMANTSAALPDPEAGRAKSLTTVSATEEHGGNHRHVSKAKA